MANEAAGVRESIQEMRKRLPLSTIQREGMSRETSGIKRMIKKKLGGMPIEIINLL